MFLFSDQLYYIVILVVTLPNALRAQINLPGKSLSLHLQLQDNSEDLSSLEYCLSCSYVPDIM